MKPSILMGLCLLPACLLASESKQAPAKAAKPMSTHVMVHAADAKWGDAPAALPAGAQAVVLSGDPGKPGNFTIRLKAPPGYRVPRHWHPTDENVTIIEGEVTLSMGDGTDAHSVDFGPGDFVALPAKMLHEASTRNGATVQIQSMGPFQITYANPADDPRKQAAAKAGDKSK